MNWTYVVYGALATAALVVTLAILRTLMHPKIAEEIKNVSITNLTIVVGLALLVLVILAWLLKCVFLATPVEPSGLGTVLAALCAVLGVGGGMQVAKRFSYVPSPPNPPDVDDVPKNPAGLGLPPNVSAALASGEKG